MVRLFTASVLACTLFCTSAFAQVAEDSYATEFFGTVATFYVEEAVPLESEYSYWADNIDPLIYDSEYLMRQANAVRTRKGQPALPEDLYLYASTNEVTTPEQVGYTLSFQDLTPDEVREILAGVDNLAALLPDAEISFSPLKSRYFDASVYSLEETIVFDRYGVNLRFAPGTGSRQMLNQLSAAFKQRFGEQTLVDSVYYNESAYNTEDSGSRMVSFQVQIEPAEDYYGEYDSDEYDG